MKIQQHKLVAEAGDPAVKQLNTPNQGGTIEPKYLIIHYTAGNSAESSINWLMNPQAKASAHLVIARDGKITQLGSFNKALWHAGKSRWADLIGLNNYSIGIELDNSGRLTKAGEKYINVSGKVIPQSEVVLETHKHETQVQAWQNYTQAQLEALKKVTLLLVNTYGLKDILGHEDIAPFRKSDPGPAFPMASFASQMLGRQDDSGEIYKTTVEDVNFRSAPEQVTTNVIGKLKKDTRLEYIKANGGWFNVFVVSGSPLLKEKIGWVHSTVIKRA
jgi:N-acetylmuramoyl-L-alanine amidase